jgi:hypothetical protein
MGLYKVKIAHDNDLLIYWIMREHPLSLVLMAIMIKTLYANEDNYLNNMEGGVSPFITIGFKSNYDI